MSSVSCRNPAASGPCARRAWASRLFLRQQALHCCATPRVAEWGGGGGGGGGTDGWRNLAGGGCSRGCKLIRQLFHPLRPRSRLEMKVHGSSRLIRARSGFSSVDMKTRRLQERSESSGFCRLWCRCRHRRRCRRCLCTRALGLGHLGLTRARLDAIADSICRQEADGMADHCKRVMQKARTPRLGAR